MHESTDYALLLLAQLIQKTNVQYTGAILIAQSELKTTKYLHFS